jgi:predicted acyltransferase
MGLIAGGMIRGDQEPWRIARRLGLAGVACLLLGALLGWLGICPVVKRIWTPSWTLYSGGWCFLILGVFYTVIEIWRWRTWAFPLVVIGMNSITAYCIAHLFDGFIAKNLKTHLGQDFFKLCGDPYEPVLHGLAVLLVFWLILFWMYRRRLFLKI